MRKLLLVCVALLTMLPVLTVSAEEPQTVSPNDGVVAYYFHGTQRCATCRKLEAYAEEAITKGFADQIASGAITWKAVNTDEPESKHFVEDFQLVSKAVVLVEYRDGKPARWENLKLIWKLVGDKDGYIAYVREETGEFLAAVSQG